MPFIDTGTFTLQLYYSNIKKKQSGKQRMPSFISYFRIIGKLGQGGMGVVYKAEDTRLNRLVALKFLPKSMQTDPEAKERFFYEARAASKLDHPNICNIHSINETNDGRIFIVMAFYKGETLKQKILGLKQSEMFLHGFASSKSSSQGKRKESSRHPSHAALPVPELINIAIPIAEGLSKAHEEDIIHRDINPSNIIITTDGLIKIIDFGIATSRKRLQISQKDTTSGTLDYMSPEQIRGERVDHRTDIWSFGVILYEMLTGELPFKGKFEEAIIFSIQNENPPNISHFNFEAPKHIRQIIDRCLMKDQKDRYHQIDALKNDLFRCRMESIAS